MVNCERIITSPFIIGFMLLAITLWKFVENDVLDNAQYYIEKFAQIFKESGIKSITSVIMEVPCCGGLPMIVKKAMQMAGVNIPMQEVIISTRGEILQRTQVKAA